MVEPKWLNHYFHWVKGDGMEKSAKDYVIKTNADGSTNTVDDVNKDLLGMLKDIDALCQRHDIPYFLNGGSALGAVRHGGFIPWDDDADIAMMRADFERFIPLAIHELKGYAIHCFELDSRYNVMIPGMKIRKKGTYIKEVNTLLPNLINECDGLFIDVFVYDYINPNKMIDFLNRIPMYALSPIIEIGDLTKINFKWAKRMFMHHAKAYGKANKGSEYIGFDLTWLFKSPLKPFVFRYDDIYPVQYVPFEDTMLPIAAHPKAYLDMAIAPSWPQLPPENKRFAKHTADIRLDMKDKRL